MSQKTLIGIDIGGTKIHIGKIFQGNVLDDLILPTNPLRPENEIMQDIIDGICRLMDPDVEGIGIGIPGLVDSDSGIVYNITNIPSWKEVYLKNKIEDNFHVRVEVANDANCFVLGEKMYGKGQNYRNIVGITLGTGLGTGLIINNSIYSGNLSVAGEFSDISYLDSIYENYCSGKFFLNMYNLSAEKMSVKAVAKEPKAIEAFQMFGNHLGNLIKTIILTYGPDIIIFGGSLSKSFDFFYPALLKKLEDFPHQNILKKLKIVPYSHNHISLVGAASLILSSRKKEITVNHTPNEN